MEYAQVLPLLSKLSRNFAKTYGLVYDDLLQEAGIAYIIAVKTYNKDLGVPFIGYLNRIVINTLNNYRLKQNGKNGNEFIDIDDFPVCDYRWDPERLYIFKEAVLNMPITARELIYYTMRKRRKIYAKTKRNDGRALRYTLVKMICNSHRTKPIRWYPNKVYSTIKTIKKILHI